jgi:hypothetical protein
MQQIETTTELLGLLASATLRPTAGDPFEASVAPGDVFRHPRDVLTYPACPLPRSAQSWRSGHPMRGRSSPAPPCAAYRVAGPSPCRSMRSWPRCRRSTATGQRSQAATRRRGVPGVRSRIAGNMDSYQQCRAELRQGVELWQHST